MKQKEIEKILNVADTLIFRENKKRPFKKEDTNNLRMQLEMLCQAQALISEELAKRRETESIKDFIRECNKEVHSTIKEK